MVVNFELFKLYQEIYRYKDEINPFLLAEFKNAILQIDDELWGKIKDKYIHNIAWAYTLEEKMIFTILAIKIPLFLDKDPMFCGELCTLLDLLDKAPQNYEKYAHIFFSEPLYSCMLDIANSTNIGIQELYELIFEYAFDGEITSQDLNEVLRLLYKIQEKSFNIIIDPNIDLKSNCLALLNYVKEINKTYITFNMKEINTLYKLYLSIDYLSDIEIETVKSKLQEIDNAYTDPTVIIKTIIKEIPLYAFTIPSMIRKRSNYDK